MTLPQAFTEQLRPYLSPIEMQSFADALSTEGHTALRLNCAKCSSLGEVPFDVAPKVPWCAEGRLLTERPNFTLDPFHHAGLYYVQEAASQFVTHILRSLLPADIPVTMLDLCAAPGGKSSAALSALPKGSLLVSNEIDRRRARILAENLCKWGSPLSTVTANTPAELGRLHHVFDVVLTDVPCSGEGMFRKDPDAISDWSPAKVNGCAQLQREILTDIWPALRPGGFLIYSTCTFNIREDEEQIAFLADQFGAEVQQVPIPDAWGIHAPLTGNLPCYRFMPHCTPGEGLFMAVVRKPAEESSVSLLDRPIRAKKGKAAASKGHSVSIELKPWQRLPQEWTTLEGTLEGTEQGELRLIPSRLEPLHRALSDQGLYLLQSGITLGTLRGRDLVPAHALAMSTALRPEAFPHAELSLDEALSYLRHEAITLGPDIPSGHVLVCYKGLPLGFVKNLGNRSNNLYPQEWRIRHL